MCKEDLNSPNLNMEGPFSLDIDEIKKLVKINTIGNYALGHIDHKGNFSVTFVGRSDSDLQTEILKHAHSSSFQQFKYSYSENAGQAFEKHCKNYHDFGGNELLLNDHHPERPDNDYSECPYCEIFDNVPQKDKKPSLWQSIKAIK